MREQQIHGGIPHLIAQGRLWLLALLLLPAASPARAGSVFKCMDTRGAVAFQATPCTAGAKQIPVDLHEQPLIDPAAPRFMPDEVSTSSAAHARPGKAARAGRAVSKRQRGTGEPVSYECRAADGEVFYRHLRCPGSVQGDGVARFGVDQTRANSRHGSRNSRGGAWGAVPVSARKIPRSEACRQINANAAAGRDGSERDDQVSVYEHNRGRDPCRGY